MATRYRPGQTCPTSGQYRVVDCATGRPTGHEVTVVRGEPFPPAPRSGLCYELADPTR